MGLMDKIMDKVMEKAQGGGGHSEQPSESYGGGGGYSGGGDSGYSSAPPPHGDLPYPWVARYDPNSGREYYVNEQTGETSWELPGPSGGGGYGGGEYGGEYGGGEYGGGGYGGGGYGESSGYPPQEQEQKKDHSMLYGVGGAALGLAGGALAMHEGEKIHDGWEDKKDDIEEGVHDFPEDAAHWTGEKVGEAEEIPENIEEGWDNTVDNIEDAPENVAEWTGEKVGAVESFGDDIGDAYDEGEAEGRGDDD